MTEHKVGVHIDEQLHIAEIQALEEEFAMLASQLRETAHALETTGTPPAEQLSDQITQARSHFQMLDEWARTYGIHSGIPAVSSESLIAVKQLLAQIGETQALRTAQDVRNRALALLERIESIAPIGGSAPPSLEDAQRQAHELKLIALSSISGDNDPQIQALVEGQHPLARLLVFIEQREQLDDETWSRLEQEIANTFSKALAVAGARGRLGVGECLRPIIEPEPRPGEKAPTPENALLEMPPEPAVHPVSDASAAAVAESKVETVAEKGNELPAAPATAVAPETVSPLPPSLEPEIESAGEKPGERASLSVTTPVSEPEQVRIESPVSIPAPLPAPQPSLAPSPASAPEAAPRLRVIPVQVAEPVKQVEMYQPRFDLTASAETIAQSAKGVEGVDRTIIVRELVWRLILDGRYGLAVQFTRALDKLSPDEWLVMPDWLIRLAALSPYVRYDASEMAHFFHSDLDNYFPELFANGKTDWSKGTRLLLIGALLQPALLSPTTGASAVLRTVPSQSDLEKFYEYCVEIADYGEQVQGLDPHTLKLIKDHAGWVTERDRLRQTAKAWFEQANVVTVSYAPATKIWRKWLDPNQHIHTVLQPILADDRSLLPAARNEMERLYYDADVRREVNYTDRNVLHRKGPDITAAALAQIQRHTHEATEFLEEWVRLQNAAPVHGKGFLYDQAERVRGSILSKQAAVYSELQACQARCRSLPIYTGVQLCLEALKQIEVLFSSSETNAPSPVAIKYVINGELLKVAGLPLNEKWEPDLPDGSEVLSVLLDYVAAKEPDWQTAFERRVETRDHEATARMIEYLQENPDPGINVDTLGQARNKSIQECQASLSRDADETSKQIEAAVALGLLRESERVDCSSDVEAIRLKIPQTLHFEVAHRRLKEVREKIQGKRNAEIEYARQRLVALEPQPAAADQERIRAALERGDVLTANEYMDMVIDHRPLPIPEDLPDPFGTFFPSTCQALADYLEGQGKGPRPDLAAVVENMRRFAKRELERYSFGPITLRPAGGTHVKQAADMLEAWLTLKHTAKITRTEVKRVLEGLGFYPREISIEKRDRRIWAEIKTEPLADRTRCPLPAFGSDAKGNYRLLFALTRPKEEDLLNDVGETTRNTPIMVFHLGRMTTQRRRDLARLCRERRRTFLVIDDPLILYLCGERGSRLPVMFQCALPFTFAEPYTSAAGLVPPEMFYGRVQERRSILDPHGSCFIYGGRQLGKTALLRDIERNSDQADKGRHVVWIDLKADGIGYDRPPDALWTTLATVFKSRGVLPEGLPANTKEDTLLLYVQKWLEQDQKRSFLLLLDEADRFLESDGKEEFIRTARIKGLMDRTDRRFKAVFAGLHNVQRTTRQENNPLAHYGDPIRIGPLLENGEWREARALVEQPMRALGFRFESPDLGTRILSQTNYYPNLIQLYCRQLLDHVTPSHRVTFDPQSSPPYIITSRHVEDAYQSQELRNAIRHRFTLTLDLDPRYRLIAFAIALYSIATDAATMNAGFSVSWIREQALTWWRDGFRGSTSEEVFRSLLEEMVGLGVLRTTPYRTYALRSPNIVSLLGTQQEIENELESSPALEAPAEYDSATFRTALRSDARAEDPRRSPLTTQQEAVLHSKENGVSMIFGTEAAGLKDLKPFLEASFGQEFFIYLDGTADEARFDEQLATLGTRATDGTTLVLVSAEAFWNEEWVQQALERVNRLTSKRSFVRIAFVADPNIAWRLIAEERGATHPAVSTFTLQPWHDAALQQWLLDFNIPVKKEGRGHIAEITGNWPLLLQQLYERVKRDPDRWEAALQHFEQALNDPKVVGSLVRELGIDNPQRRRILRDLALLGEASTDDLLGIVDGVPREIIQPTLNWADRLGLVSLVSDKLWRVQPLVARVLRLHGE